jgi:hypothetical protein
VVDLAAGALLLGVGDPLSMLSLDLGGDWITMQAIVTRAGQLRAERVKVEYEALAAMIGNAVGKQLSG